MRARCRRRGVTQGLGTHTLALALAAFCYLLAELWPRGSSTQASLTVPASRGRSGARVLAARQCVCIQPVDRPGALLHGGLC